MIVDTTGSLGRRMVSWDSSIHDLLFMRLWDQYCRRSDHQGVVRRMAAPLHALLYGMQSINYRVADDVLK